MTKELYEKNLNFVSMPCNKQRFKRIAAGCYSGMFSALYRAASGIITRELFKEINSIESIIQKDDFIFMIEYENRACSIGYYDINQDFKR